jgi:rubredoxin
MDVAIEKIPGGLSVDGFAFKNGKCGCTAVLPCCYSWSKVKVNGDRVSFVAKLTGPETKDMFTWGYKVGKAGIVVEVSVEDARDKKIFSGYYPPPVEDLVRKGWKILERSGEREDFGIWRCSACKWLYKGREQNAVLDDLPADWKCPVCTVGKESFEQVG